MIMLHPEFLKKEGRKEFVVLPYEEFVALQELQQPVASRKNLSESTIRCLMENLFEMF